MRLALCINVSTHTHGSRFKFYLCLKLCADCNFQNHIEHLRAILYRLYNYRLKVNDKRQIFGLNNIPYLGYISILGSIKPYPKKVYGIIDLIQPTTTTRALVLIGTVKYYIA